MAIPVRIHNSHFRCKFVWLEFVFAKFNTGVAYFFTTIILLATASATPVIIHNFTFVIISVRISENFFTNYHQN